MRDRETYAGLMASTGYNLIPGSVQGVAAEIGQMATDLSSIETAWQNATKGAASALRIEQLVTAFNALQTKDTSTLNAYVSAVRQLHDRIQTAAITYVKDDDDAAAAYQKTVP